MRKKEMSINLYVTGSLQKKNTSAGRTYYYVVLDYPRQSGEKRRTKWISTHIEATGLKSKKQAEAFMAETIYKANKYEESLIEKEEKKEIKPREEYLSLQEAVDTFLEYKSTQVAPPSLDQYRHVLNNLVLYFGERKNFFLLTVKDIILYQSGWKDKYKPATITTRIIYLKAFIAFIYNLYEKTPPNLSLIKAPGTKRNYTLPSADFIRFVNNKIYTTDNTYFRKYRTLFLLLCCAMRSGEILSLRWQDIDFMQKRINVRFHLQNNNVVPGTKNKQTRCIMMPDRIYELLQQEYTSQLQISDKETLDACFVVGNRPVHTSHQTIRRYFYKVLTAMQLEYYGKAEPGIRMHDFRHAVATTCVYQKIDLKSVSALLGHSNMLSTQRYIHFVEAMQDAPTPVLNGLF